MAFDGIVLNSIIKELSVLKDGKVNKIYEPSKDELIFSIYANNNNFALNININANDYRIHLTTRSKPNPYSAPNFCMLLRKYLIGAKISRIYMNDLERIAFIEYECLNEMNDKVIRTLVIELMGKYSNVILLNQDNNIIDALKKHDSENINSRSIMPARKYIFPISKKQNIYDLSEKEFIDYCKNNESHTLDTIVPNNFTGISKMFIQASLEELNLSNTVTEKSLKEIYNYIKNILNSNNDKCKKYKNNYVITLEKKNEELENNFFLDDYYFFKSQEELYKNYRNDLLKVINYTLDKITRKLDNINSKISSCKNMEKYKIYGELLIANIYRVDTLKINNDFVELENYYNNNEYVKIPVENNLTTSENAEKYFKKYNRFKNTLEVVNVQKKDAEQELNYLESLIYEIDNAQDIDSVNEIYNEISEIIKNI